MGYRGKNKPLIQVDNKELREYTDAHLAEKAIDDVHGLLSGGKIIEETGSNVNGHYVKFADGTMTCYFKAPDITGISVAGNVVYAFPSDYTYPASFKTEPAVSICAYPTDVGGNRSYNTTVLFGSTSIWVKPHFKNITGVLTVTRIINISLFAIGRWK